MKITDYSSNVSFGYNSPLKTLFKKGKLPTVTKGFYGGTLTNKTVSLEHLIPHSQGGKPTCQISYWLQKKIIAGGLICRLRTL